MKRIRLVDTGFCSDIIEVCKATKIKDRNAIAIHLLNPTKSELERAIEDAIANLFNRVVVHTNVTWPQTIVPKFHVKRGAK